MEASLIQEIVTKLNIKEGAKLEELISFIKKDKGPSNISIEGPEKGSLAYLLSKVLPLVDKDRLIITPTQKEAEILSQDLIFFIANENIKENETILKKEILIYPDINIPPFTTLSIPSDIPARRMAILFSLLQGEGHRIIISSVEAVIRKTIPKEELIDDFFFIQTGEETDQNDLLNFLAKRGYSYTSLVEEMGEFSKRGDIIDIFSPLYDYPFRLEFFGDYVESIRLFDPLTQRSIKDLDEVIVIPSKEAVPREESPSTILSRLKKWKNGTPEKFIRDKEIIDAVMEGREFPGGEFYLPMYYKKLDSIFSYIDKDSIIILIEPEEIRKNIKALLKNFESFREKAFNSVSFLPPVKELLLTETEFQEALSSRPIWHISPFSIEYKDMARFYFYFERNEEFSSKEIASRIRKDWLSLIKRYMEEGLKIIIAVETESRLTTISHILEEHGIPFKKTDSIIRYKNRNFKEILLISGCLSSGFKFFQEGIIVLTDKEIFGQKKRVRPIEVTERATKIRALSELEPEDLVVHMDHGIGRYKGLVSIELGGIKSDFLQIEYQGNDILYIPVDRFNTLHKYVGVHGKQPSLSKLGGKTWERSKKRAKKAAQEVAKELLKLYALRNVKEGFAFSTHEELYEKFVERFPFEETPDQARTIEEVLSDMEQAKPMDRLVCGDVGYGKTEVALRAAFKAVMDLKQVAFLVPTTILAEQHFETFKERFRDYPVEIRCLSRFRSRKEQKEIIEGLISGKVDIVIGTHRLLQKDVSFKDLGLLIIDEEHRFGVKHKEKLKGLKTEVDVLTLTATPIPRTLNLFLVGLRDMSLIETPPQDRQSIETYVSRFEPMVIKTAIERELNRKGQVFFVHNRVGSIHAVAKLIEEIVPKARIAVAHGQMSERSLEEVMFKFIKKEIDVLVCTTIIESGLDIPSANTIIINKAERLGLAQMYQLRGRVGRSAQKAYAYLLISDETYLSPEAQKRLKALMDFSELGVGFKLAFHDLQIRGAGDILGISQSGHIAEVGYELYLRMLEKEIRRLKGEASYEDEYEPEIQHKESAFIPEEYIPDVSQRLNLYRRLSSIKTENEIEELKEEILDRFGKPPKETRRLIELINFKLFLKKVRVKSIKLEERSAYIEFLSNAPIDSKKVLSFFKKKGLELKASNAIRLRLDIGTMEARIKQIKKIISNITKIDNKKTKERP